jgi:hypothetical protein
LIQPHAQALQQTLYQHDNTGDEKKEADNRASKIDQLSQVTRFILVAAYIASFNPIDADMKHFAAQVPQMKYCINIDISVVASPSLPSV